MTLQSPLTMQHTNTGGSGPFVATLGINGGEALPVGTYRLFICDTTSIDAVINSIVIPPQQGGSNQQALSIPKAGWDVNWLDKNAGWLNGSAFSTWKGNSVITAHVWDALNKPGPFADLKELKYGDQIKIHAFGQIFTYELRESTVISPTNTAAMLKHEEKSWLTLITCEDYQELTQKYPYRRMVRAVLGSVTVEK